ncbi:hypothetical protein LIKHA_27 [Paenibacillus phage Likha]|uniref:Uncharacterized protein n=1 Tax=Paenibacillus phage Likha TaxID=2070193 RepID=A0A2I7SDH5_9CAUD|nr:hypothetical protein HWB48_gp27 [Paenibacillus phage Likha]AUS03926.1 hypothetical protein LIKHA_27 [Paenibacillus phage Likha]
MYSPSGLFILHKNNLPQRQVILISDSIYPMTEVKRCLDLWNQKGCGKEFKSYFLFFSIYFLFGHTKKAHSPIVQV